MAGIDQSTAAKVAIMRPTREEVLTLALHHVAARIPSTKGMDPKARAQRLHAEIERRISIAREALYPKPEWEAIDDAR